MAFVGREWYSIRYPTKHFPIIKRLKSPLIDVSELNEMPFSTDFEAL